MESNFKFSIIVAVYNVEKYLEETINSIINQDIGFTENVQLILVDDGSTDNSKQIALNYQKKFPNNILVLSKENGGQSSARNLGLKYAKGDYVNFLDSDDKLSENTLREVYYFLINHNVDIVAIPLIFFDRQNGNHTLNDKFLYKKVINVYEEFDYPQLSIASCFIKTKLFNKFHFDERFNIGEDAVLINKLLVNESKIGFINEAKYLYRKRNDDSSTIDGINLKKEFYLNKSKYFHVELIEYCLDKLNYVPQFIQYVITHDLQWYYNDININDILSETEFNRLIKEIRFILSYIDENIILNHKYLSKDKKSFLIYLKNDDFHIVARPQKNKVFLKSNDYIINKLHNHQLHLDIVELDNDYLNISGLFASNCDILNLSVGAIMKDKHHLENIFNAKYVEYPTTYRHTNVSLNIPWKFYYDFDFKININELDNCTLSLFVDYSENNDNVRFYPKIKLRNYCNLSEFSNYMVKDNKIILFKDNKFHIVDYSFKFMLKLELISLFKILTSLEPYDIYAIFIHILNIISYPFWKNRKIWLFIDRPTIADDNAKHLFKYSISQSDDVEKYFIVDKKSKDYSEMKKISENIIHFRSLKHKLLYLHAEKIISSHVDHIWLNPFYKNNEKLFSGLTTIKKIFLQHGATQGDISHWIRKYYHNLHLIVTTSDLEKNSFLYGNYNFDENVVQTLGFPRFDNLSKNPIKKQILFMPTWRNFLKDEISFINSDYCKRLNVFFNDKELLKLMKYNECNIIFKPHYNLLPFIDLLNIPKDIIITTEDSYQKLFNESSLLITDYSSVFFDFAYLKKPVIYYQHDDYHYNEGYFKYDSMGFGDVISSHENLISKIKYYINNNYEMEEKYEKRVDKFFKYTDKNNSKRVYEWLIDN